MPKKKAEHEKAKKISISIPRAIWNLAEVRMFNLRQGESEYVRDLIKKDTHELWVQQTQSTAAPALGGRINAALLNEEPGNPQALPHTGAEILRPRKISAGGSGTPTIRYPKKQRGKSSK